MQSTADTISSQTVDDDERIFIREKQTDEQTRK